jgi:hypothetical protein
LSERAGYFLLTVAPTGPTKGKREEQTFPIATHTQEKAGRRGEKPLPGREGEEGEERDRGLAVGRVADCDNALTETERKKRETGREVERPGE